MNERTIETSEELDGILLRLTMGEPLRAMNWSFERRTIPDYGWLVWTRFDRPDTITGVIGRGTLWREFVPIGAAVSSVVRACWILVKLTTEHEAMEAFRFEGERVFDPHAPIVGGDRFETLLGDLLASPRSLPELCEDLAHNGRPVSADVIKRLAVAAGFGKAWG